MMIRLTSISTAVLSVAMFHPLLAQTRAQTPTPTERAELVEQALLRLRTELEYPGLTSDVAARNLQTPQRVIQFVQHDVFYATYPDSFGGAAGTLRTRVGNCTDKAVLTAQLLELLGYTTRIVRADWPNDATPLQGTGAHQPLKELEPLAQALGTRLSQLPRLHPSNEAARAVQDEVAAATERLQALMPLAKWSRWESSRNQTKMPEGAAIATPIERDWVWVQYQTSDGAWHDADPVFGDQPRPAKVQAFNPEPIQFVIRIRDGDTVILNKSFVAADVLGYDFHLTLLPAKGGLAAAEAPKQVKVWRPRLSVGSIQHSGEPFEVTPAAPTPGGLGGVGGGLGGLVGSRQPVPSERMLTLEVQFKHKTGQPWSKPYRRILHRISGKKITFDPANLVAQYRLVVGMTIVPPRVVEARLVDEVLAAIALQRSVLSSGPLSFPQPRGYSSRTCRLLNEIVGLQVAGMGPIRDASRLVWRGPAVMLESTTLAEGKQRTCEQRLDILHSAFGVSSDSSDNAAMRWGLATCAAEAQLLAGQSVNQFLLKNNEPQMMSKGTTKPSWLDPIHREILEDGGVIIADMKSQAVWVLPSNAELLGTVTSNGVLSKGVGRSVVTPERGYVAGATAAMIMVGNPSTLALAGLAGYFTELSKAYNGAANKIEVISNLFGGGSSPPANQGGNADDGLRDLAERLTRELAAGALRGWANAAVGGMINGGLPLPRRPGTAIDSGVRGLVGAGLTLPDELPVISGLIESSLDAVMSRR